MPPGSTDLRPAFAGRFPFEAADAADLPGLWSPEVFEPGELTGPGAGPGPGARSRAQDPGGSGWIPAGFGSDPAGVRLPASGCRGQAAGAVCSAAISGAAGSGVRRPSLSMRQLTAPTASRMTGSSIVERIAFT